MPSCNYESLGSKDLGDNKGNSLGIRQMHHRFLLKARLKWNYLIPNERNKMTLWT